MQRLNSYFAIALSTSVLIPYAFAAKQPGRAASPKAALTSTAELEPSVPKTQLWLHPKPVVRPAEIASGLASSNGAPEATFLNTGTEPEGDMPRDVEYTPDGTQVVVVNRDTDNVTFLNTTTREVTHTVGVGDFPVDIAVSSNGLFAVTPNVFDNTVSIIDVPNHALLANVPVTGSQPYRVEITPDGNFAVVGVINDGLISAFSIIDLVNQTETANFPSSSQGVIGFFFTPESGINGNIFTQFALSPDGDTIVLPDRGNSSVKIYSRSTGLPLANLVTAAGPTSVDISADGLTAVVGHDSPGNAITEIDLLLRLVTGSFTTAQQFGQVIRITPDKQYAITGILNNTIFVNLTTGLTDTTIMTGIVGDIEISFNGQYAIVSNFNFRVIDIATRSLVDTIPFGACVEAATSPTQLRAVALNNRFREDVQFYNINGALGTFEGVSLSGPAPEGDSSRNVAISPDGQRIVVCHNTSRNAAIDNLATDTIDAYVEVGERPLGAAITPDGQYAVVCATDANAVRIIDLSVNTIVASIFISTRPVHVRISPDSQFAYVLNVAGVDQITFIELDGASSSIVAQLPAGQTGSALGYSYTEVSGIELTQDGSILGVCDSFNDFLLLFDTATQTQIAAVPVGDFPIRVGFSPDGTQAYVANAFGDSVTAVSVNGPLSLPIGTVLGIEFPLTVNVDDAGAYAYVGNTDGNNPGIHVIDTLNNTQVGFVSLNDPARDSHYSADDDTLYVATTGAEFVRINASGPTSSIVDVTPLTASPSDMAFNDATKTAVIAQPIPDGVVDIIQFPLPCPPDIAPAKTKGDDIVNVDDLLSLIGAWGPCP